LKNGAEKDCIGIKSYFFTGREKFNLGTLGASKEAADAGVLDKSNENCRISFIPWAMGSVDHSSRAGAEISW
jgi:hypothetical protein